MGRYETFIVRLWTGGSDEAPRGNIQHIASRRVFYFKDAARLLDFIHEHTKPAVLPMFSENAAPLPEPELYGRGEADDR